MLEPPLENKKRFKEKFLNSPTFYLVFILTILSFIYFGFSSHWFLSQEKKFLFKVSPQNEDFKSQNPISAPYFSSEKAFGPRIAGLNILAGGFLQPSPPPFLIKGQVLGVLTERSSSSFSSPKDIQEYIVKKGDTLWGIAEKFGISLNTILWANNLGLRSTIQPGQKLVILPVSGVMHIVHKGETLSQIAETYQLKVQEIVKFNGLKSPDDIFVGDLLILPNAKMPKKATTYPSVPLPRSAFICPIPKPCRITQGLHWFNAVDFSNGQCGEPVYAVAGGKVQRTGYDSISGKYIRIIHNNGVITFYGHLSKVMVGPGTRVSQGEIIGYTGHTGYTIPKGPAGCHLHFDVRFAKNPFAK